MTGAASGIGRATSELLQGQGHQVIGIDLHSADIDADLSAPQRATLAEQVIRALPSADSPVDAVLAVAGVGAPTALSVRVNYIGAVATMEVLRPLLTRSHAPRAVVVVSFAALEDNDATSST